MGSLYRGHVLKCGLVCRTGRVVAFSQREIKSQTGAGKDGSVSKLRGVDTQAGGPKFESPNPHKIALAGEEVGNRTRQIPESYWLASLVQTSEQETLSQRNKGGHTHTRKRK